MKNIILTYFLLSVTCLSYAQGYQGDWETYVQYIDKRPVSVIVDLAFGTSPEAKQRPNVIIVSVTLPVVLKDGMPAAITIRTLDTIENRLADELGNGLNALYAGRYTNNGKRDYFFYTNDTTAYAAKVREAMAAYPLYTFSALSRRDEKLDNYQNVLYPAGKELQRIFNRRMLDALQKDGNLATAPRKIDHYLFFKTEALRKKFALIVQDNGFKVENAGEEKGIKEKPFSLQISRIDKTDTASIDKVSLYLWELALQYNAKYDGWETFAVKQ